MDFSENLINLVEPHRCLYDWSNKDFKNLRKKDKIWEDISKKLNRDRDAIKSKWKNLKDGYAKYKKNFDGTTQAGQKNSFVNWIWAPHLRFLDGARPKRLTSSSIAAYSENAETDADSVDSNYLNESIENVEIKKELSLYSTDDPLSRAEEASPPTNRASRKRKLSDSSDNQNDLTDKVIEYLHNKKKKDSIDLLFASYAQSIKRMKPATQASVKIKLAQIFAEAELQDLQIKN